MVAVNETSGTSQWPSTDFEITVLREIPAYAGFYAGESLFLSFPNYHFEYFLHLPTYANDLGYLLNTANDRLRNHQALFHPPIRP